jgi:ribonuclease D
MTGNPVPRSRANIDPPRVVDTLPALHEMVAQVMQHPQVGVDTEANSLYAYRERVCLIQISVPGINYLVDPLALDDVSPLSVIFSAPHIEKIFHAADYDLSVLLRDFRFICSSLFDTMWAGRILGWPKVGLGDILEKYFGQSVNKSYQRYNWGKRPLDPKALTYAWMDSHYLLSLRDLQLTELKAKGRWEEAQEVFSYLLETVHVPENLLATHFWRIKDIHKLSQREQKILYQLFMWRECEAERLNRPTMKVISSQRLVRLARTRPLNMGELVTAGLTNHQAQRFGQGILKVLRDSNPTKLPPQPNQKHPPADVINRFKKLRIWRKDTAASRGVDSDVILPNAVLWELAEHPPQTLQAVRDIVGIGPWRSKTYGPGILELLAHEA